MNAFTGANLDPAALERVTAEARTPMYFQWPESAWFAITFRGVHVVYILGFEGGTVKVGHTEDFLTRMSANRSSPRRHGNQLLCGWRVGTEDALKDEATLKELAADLGALRIGRSNEWFTGVDVHELIAAAESALVPITEAAA